MRYLNNQPRTALELLMINLTWLIASKAGFFCCITCVIGWAVVAGISGWQAHGTLSVINFNGIHIYCISKTVFSIELKHITN